MAARTPAPAIVFFTIAGDPDTYFARRLGHVYRAANRYRGHRLCGLHSRFGPQLVAGSIRIPVRVIPAPEVAA